jgi:EAL domain-containing protein (putative c-di-GMP-specific phosphodiesterase class I)
MDRQRAEYGPGRDEDDSAIVSGVISMARPLSLATMAEGVETSECLMGLRALGSDFAQGYLLREAAAA